MVRTKHVVVLAAGLAVLTGCGDAERDPSAVPTPAQAEASEILSREPYMGVSCPEANTYACDRVGLAVWLAEPAVSVNAAIEGRALALDDPEWSGAAREDGRRMFAGFLQPAGLVDGPLALTDDDGPGRWIGREPVSATVDLEIVRAGGQVEQTQRDVRLSAGWG